MKSIFVLIFAVFFNGTVLGQTFSVEATNGVISFPSVSYFKDVVINSNSQTKSELLSYISSNLVYTPLANDTTSSLYSGLSDGFFEFIINSEGYCKIGSFVYKIDLTNEKIILIPYVNFNASLRSQLNSSNYSDSTLLAYSLYDDVFDCVENNIPPNSNQKQCKEAAAKQKSKSAVININEPNSSILCSFLGAEVKCINTGIYSKLFSRIRRESCVKRFVVIHRDPVTFVPICGVQNGPNSQWDIPMETPANNSVLKMEELYYVSTKPLKKYKLRVVFMAKDSAIVGNPDNPSIDLLINEGL